DLGEDISVSSLSQFDPNPRAQGFPQFQFLASNRVSAVDVFTTRNEFFGGQFGASNKLYLGDLVMDVSGPIAIGDTREEIHIEGGQARVLPGGASIVTPGGVLAQLTNMGRFHRHDFSVVPELNVDFAYWITDHVSISLGYSFLWWNKVARPGDQI